MERDESSATFAALQRASGDFLLTSPNWDDDRLAELDDLPEDARGPLIRAFVQDFLNGSDVQPGSASEKSASSRSYTALASPREAQLTLFVFVGANSENTNVSLLNVGREDAREIT